jgi:hypothetical protein
VSRGLAEEIISDELSRRKKNVNCVGAVHWGQRQAGTQGINGLHSDLIPTEPSCRRRSILFCVPCLKKKSLPQIFLKQNYCLNLLIKKKRKLTENQVKTVTTKPQENNT